MALSAGTVFGNLGLIHAEGDKQLREHDQLMFHNSGRGGDQYPRPVIFINRDGLALNSEEPPDRAAYQTYVCDRRADENIHVNKLSREQHPHANHEFEEKL